MTKNSSNSLPGCLALTLQLLGVSALAAQPDPSVPQPAATRSSPPVYTEMENTLLFYCVGLTDTAKSVADMKLQGTTAKDVKRRQYPEAEMKEMFDTIVDKVYEESFTSAWDYAVGFFGYCALEIAKVSEVQAGFGSDCFQNSQIAADAVDLRQLGHSKKEIIKRFSAFKGDTPKEVIEKTWAGNQDRSTAALDAWSLCMKPVTRG